MRILITGAGGFVGRALIGALGDQHDIVAIDSAPNPFGNLPIRYMEGDLANSDVRDAACRDRIDALVHLATVPGGAAEQNPANAFAVNVMATAALLERVAAGGNTPRVLFASSIAVLGDPLPPHVDDATPLQPRMVYGAHKAMIEQWIATLTRRGAIEGLSLRFPGIIARPKGPSGMKSAFMSDVFHAAAAHESFVCPVSAEATLWLMSVTGLVRNLIHALEAPAALFTEPYALTLPAVRTSMGALALEAARQTGADPALVHYDPDAALEAGFGRQPPLETPAADAAGFRHDGSLEALVTSALATLN
jgi:nucleoside-diphosphate-sugar epimerase